MADQILSSLLLNIGQTAINAKIRKNNIPKVFSLLNFIKLGYL